MKCVQFTHHLLAKEKQTENSETVRLWGLQCALYVHSPSALLTGCGILGKSPSLSAPFISSSMKQRQCRCLCHGALCRLSELIHMKPWVRAAPRKHWIHGIQMSPGKFIPIHPMLLFVSLVSLSTRAFMMCSPFCLCFWCLSFMQVGTMTFFPSSLLLIKQELLSQRWSKDSNFQLDRSSKFKRNITQHTGVVSNNALYS